MEIKIVNDKGERYGIWIDGHYVRACFGYDSLVRFIGNQLKLKFKMIYTDKIEGKEG
jgi:hypothetical protein